MAHLTRRKASSGETCGGDPAAQDQRHEQVNATSSSEACEHVYQRSEDANARAKRGHWESDLIISRRMGAWINPQIALEATR